MANREISAPVENRTLDLQQVVSHYCILLHFVAFVWYALMGEGKGHTVYSNLLPLQLLMKLRNNIQNVTVYIFETIS